MRFSVGDIILIPLPDKRTAYAHYVYKDKNFLHLIQIQNYFTKDGEHFDINLFIKAKQLFPPIFTVLNNGVKLEGWKVIGNQPVTNFKFPNFLNTAFYFTGKAGKWYLYDGDKEIPIGKEVPAEYKKLEFCMVYAPDNIVKRIMTGIKPLEDLINTNTTANPNPIT